MPSVELYHFPDHTTSTSDEAQECGKCHTMHFWFFNRFGETFCINCDKGDQP